MARAHFGVFPFETRPMTNPLFSMFSAILDLGKSSLIGSSVIFPCPEESPRSKFLRLLIWKDYAGRSFLSDKEMHPVQTKLLICKDCSPTLSAQQSDKVLTKDKRTTHLIPLLLMLSFLHCWRKLKKGNQSFLLLQICPVLDQACRQSKDGNLSTSVHLPTTSALASAPLALATPSPPNPSSHSNFLFPGQGLPGAQVDADADADADAGHLLWDVHLLRLVHFHPYFFAR